LALTLMSLIACTENLNMFDKVGVASTDKSGAVMAVAYSVAKTNTDQYFINNQKGYASPEYVAKLPKRKPLSGGEIISVDELPSATDYYDGSRKLRITTTSCTKWTTLPDLCKGQPTCGWCASTNSCIPGNTSGPLAPCLAGRFFYSAPNPNFNLLSHDNYNLARKAIGGAQLTTVTDNTK